MKACLGAESPFKRFHCKSAFSDIRKLLTELLKLGKNCVQFVLRHSVLLELRRTETVSLRERAAWRYKLSCNSYHSLINHG